MKRLDLLIEKKSTAGSAGCSTVAFPFINDGGTNAVAFASVIGESLSCLFLDLNNSSSIEFGLGSIFAEPLPFFGGGRGDLLVGAGSIDIKLEEPAPSSLTRLVGRGGGSASSSSGPRLGASRVILTGPSRRRGLGTGTEEAERVFAPFSLALGGGRLGIAGVLNAMVGAEWTGAVLRVTIGFSSSLPLSLPLP